MSFKAKKILCKSIGVAQCLAPFGQFRKIWQDFSEQLVTLPNYHTSSGSVAGKSSPNFEVWPKMGLTSDFYLVAQLQ